MNIFYKSKRVGKDGKEFYMYKFRTMIDNDGPPTASDNDPRITKIGKWLRRTKIDELPQLINVLKGDMALVGPRPEVPEVVALMTEEERKIILSVKPGITDKASLWNYNEGELLKGSLDPHQDYLKYIWPKKKALQIVGIQNKSFWYDLKIIIKTIIKLWIK